MRAVGDMYQRRAFFKMGSAELELYRYESEQSVKKLVKNCGKRTLTLNIRSRIVRQHQCRAKQNRRWFFYQVERSRHSDDVDTLQCERNSMSDETDEPGTIGQFFRRKEYVFKQLEVPAGWSGRDGQQEWPDLTQFSG